MGAAARAKGPLTICFLFFALFYGANISLAQSVTIQGKLATAAGTPVTGAQTDFTINIYTPGSFGNKCLLYSERQRVNLTGSNGLFSVGINGGGSTRLPPTTYSFEQAIANRGPFNIASSYCDSGAGAYSPSPTDNRRMEIIFQDETMSTAETIPAIEINPVPYSMDAVAVGGTPSNALLKVADANTDPALTTFSSADFSDLKDLISGSSAKYMAKSSSGGAQVPVYSGSPSSVSNGSFWLDSADGKMKYRMGGVTRVLDSSSTGSPISSVSAGPGLAGTGTSDITLSLPSQASAGIYGGASSIPQIQVDGYGRVIAASSVPLISSGGTVTSVGVSVPSYMTATGGPITSNGAIAVGFSSQTANQVFAAPLAASGTPGFRDLRITDLRSATGTDFFNVAGGCAAGTTLTFDSAASTVSCQAYSITSAQVSGALGFSPVNKAGDSMSGSLTLPGNGLTVGSQISTLSGNVQIGTSSTVGKLNVGGSIHVADGAEGCSASTEYGLVRFSSGALQFCNASGWQTLGVSGAGLTSLNGLTGNTQTFAVGSLGTAPAFVSSGGVHTINLPMASAASVTAGLLSKADYDSFAGKQIAGNYLTILTGDVTSSGFSAGSATTTIANGAITDAKVSGVGADKITSAAGKYFTYAPNGAACSTGQVMKWNGTQWNCGTDNGLASESDPTVQAWAKNAPSADFITTGSTLGLNSIGVAKGGTGLNSLGSSNQILGVNSAANALEYKTVTAGSGVTVNHSAGALTISATGSGGTVTSVAVSVPSILSATGGPITGAGTIALSLNNQSSGQVFAGPVTGASGAPTFRGLQKTDTQSSFGGNFFNVGADCPAGQALQYELASDTVLCKAVVLNGSQITAALGFTPVNKAGDTMNGALKTLGDINVYNGANSTDDGGAINFGVSNQPTYSPMSMIKGVLAFIPGSSSEQQGGIAFSTRQSGAAGQVMTERMRLTHAGNFGVGTTAPNSKFDVQGGAISSGAQGAGAGQGGEHRFYELTANGTDYVGFRAPDAIGSSRIWTLPAADGASGQVLSTNGSGGLSWATASAGSVTSVSGTAPVTVTGTTTPTISMAAATASVNGYLSSTDWSTFNNKANIASPTFTGVPAAPTAAANTNSTQLATTAFVLGQAGVASPLMDAASAVVGTSLRYAREDHVHPVDSSRAPAVGSSSITTLGTITTGTWNGTTITVPNGGTGLTSGTAGGVPYFATSTTMASTAAGTAGQVLTLNGSGVPIWAAAATGSVTGSGTINYLSKFSGSSTALTSSQIFDDGTNIGVGTTGPSVKLDVRGGDIFTRLDHASSGAGIGASAGGSEIKLNGAGTHHFSLQNAAGNLKIGTTDANTSLGATLTPMLTILGTGGNVGIGTGNPTTKLHVLGSALFDGGSGSSSVSINRAGGQYGQLIFQTAGSARWNLYADSGSESGSNAGSDFQIQAYSDAGTAISVPLTIKRATGNALFNGSVGIGTTAPSASLHVAGLSKISSLAPAQRYDETDQSGATGLWQWVGDGGGIRLDRNTAAGRDFSTYHSVISSDLNGNLRLGGDPNTGGGTATSMFIAANSPQIGIGTSAPSAALQIKNSGYSNMLTLGENYGTTTNTQSFHIFNFSDGNNYIDSKTKAGGYTYYRTGQNGEVSYNRSYMIVNATNGFVGIGGGIPSAALDVTTVSDFPMILRNSNQAGFWKVGPYSVNGGFYIIDDANAGAYLAKGNTNPGWLNNSDARLKTGIQPLPESKGLAAILKLRPVSYKWRDLKNTQDEQTGLIAQEVQQVMPSMVSAGRDVEIHLADGKKATVKSALGVAYTGLVVPLVKAVQELAAKLDTLTSQSSAHDRAIAALRAENATLKAAGEAKAREIASLKEAICEINPKAKACKAKK
jgi:hypothetical protein